MYVLLNMVKIRENITGKEIIFEPDTPIQELKSIDGFITDSVTIIDKADRKEITIEAGAKVSEVVGAVHG